MPSIFISYASQQQTVAQQLEAELIEKGIQAWRDKTQLHAGERWPKALGDAIAASDAMVLLWSSEANQSDFVELEWNIAMAMQKPVMPCLLDETSLPPTLKPSHRVPGNDLQKAADQILTALQEQLSAVSSDEQTKLLHTLTTVQATEPKQVLQRIQAVFNQPNLSVGGHLIQAHGPINIGTIEHGSKTTKDQKPLVERWQTWVGLLVSILTAITLFLSLPAKWKDFLPGWKGQSTTSQSLGGYIFDAQTHNPLPHVQVTLTGGQLENTKKTSETNEQGYFLFQESVPTGVKVNIEAKLTGYIRVWEENIEFGDSSMKFKMEKDIP